jgi:hypothetical protein
MFAYWLKYLSNEFKTCFHISDNEMKPSKPRYQPWILEDIAFYAPTLLIARAASERIRSNENSTEPFGTIFLESGHKSTRSVPNTCLHRIHARNCKSLPRAYSGRR